MADTIALPEFVKRTKLSRDLVCRRLRALLKSRKVSGIKDGSGPKARWAFPAGKIAGLVKLVQEFHDSGHAPRKPKRKVKPRRKSTRKPATTKAPAETAPPAQT